MRTRQLHFFDVFPDDLRSSRTQAVQWAKVFQPTLGVGVVPTSEFVGYLEQPTLSVWKFKDVALFICFEIFVFFADVLFAETFIELGANGGSFWNIGVGFKNFNECPVVVYGTVPVVASVKRWPDISWCLGVSRFAQRLVVIVWCWLSGTIQGKFGKIRSALSRKCIATVRSGAH